MLVTTPSSLLRLALELDSLSLSRCCHLVFDDADTTFNVYNQEVKAIVRLYRHAHDAEPDMLDQVSFERNSSKSYPLPELVIHCLTNH